MRKRILTVDKEKLKELFLAQLDKTTFYGASDLTLKVSVDDAIPKDVVDPKIYITPTAYSKMWTLVQHCDKEIAWHGLVRHKDREYTICDILVYPQTVTSVTATSIDDDYPIWVSELRDEEINHMRMQGHSHVNMGVTPSGVDEQYYQDLLTHVQDYYIIFVLNKKHEATIRFYDVENNIIYDGLSCEVLIYNKPATAWYDQASENVHEPKARTTVRDNGYDLEAYYRRWNTRAALYDDIEFETVTVKKGGEKKNESKQTSKFFRSK